jgi:hypothetical protein
LNNIIINAANLQYCLYSFRNLWNDVRK